MKYKWYTVKYLDGGVDTIKALAVRMDGTRAIFSMRDHDFVVLNVDWVQEA